MQTVVNVIFLLALYWFAWKVLYAVTASLPGCTEREFMVFYRLTANRRACTCKCTYTFTGAMSLRRIGRVENALESKYGGTVAVTGFHLMEERNVFPRRAWAALARLGLWLWSELLHPWLSPLRRAWAWVSVMWTRTEDHAVAEYEAEREMERILADEVEEMQRAPIPWVEERKACEEP